jgi:pSer/pThr/pTyr-binding forkhead associated (FHA) protein
MEGLSYHLRATEHVLGRQGQIQLEDEFLSPQHANLFYRNGQLTLRDEGSLNGTFVRVRGKAKLALGDTFLVGDQLFRVEAMPPVSEYTDAAGTYFYASPSYSSPYRVVQILAGGGVGLAHCPRGSRVTIGRRGCDINVFDDLHLSEEHCSLEQDADGFSLTDLESKNGTFVRLKREQSLDHGDYFIVGRKLLRVDMNA